MKAITYTKTGIEIDGESLSLTEITERCNTERIKDEKIIILKMEWSGYRGFEGITEKIALPIKNIETIKKHILGKEIYFGEIAGKHSEIYNTLDDNDIELISDIDEIHEFLKNYPSGHEYNYSFLHTFSDNAKDGYYETITEEDLKEFDKMY